MNVTSRDVLGASPGTLVKLGVPKLFEPQRAPLRRAFVLIFPLFDETL